MAGRKRHYLTAKTDKVFRLTCKKHFSVFIKSVKQRSDSDRVTRRNIFMGFSVINYESKLRIKLFEHIRSVFLIKRQKQLTVGIADKGIALFNKLIFELSEAIKLTVADNKISVFFKGLHSALINAHNCKAMETEEALSRVYHTGHIRASGLCFFKALFKFFKRQRFAAVSHY